MPSPLVSAVIITYNQQNFIEETLRSVLEQDYEGLEVVVSDDGSTDSTPRIIRALAAEYPDRLVPILDPRNAGITANTNRALRACRGELITFLGGDDLMLPGKIGAQAGFMRAHPEVAISHHDVEVFDSDTGRTLYLWSQRFGKRTGGIRSVIRYGPYMCGPSVMLRRDCLPPEGMDERVRAGSDWLLYARVLDGCRGSVGYLDQVLARYRRSSANVTRDWSWKFEDQNMTLALIESRWLEYAFEVRQRRSELYFTQALRYFSAGRRSTAAGLLLNALLIALPAMPWLRLVFREALFSLRRKGGPDDMLEALFRHA